MDLNSYRLYLTTIILILHLQRLLPYSLRKTFFFFWISTYLMVRNSFPKYIEFTFHIIRYNIGIEYHKTRKQMKIRISINAIQYLICVLS